MRIISGQLNLKNHKNRIIEYKKVVKLLTFLRIRKLDSYSF